MNRIYAFVFALLTRFAPCAVLPAILDYLKKLAEKTESRTDDKLVEVLEDTFQYVFPECFDGKEK